MSKPVADAAFVSDLASLMLAGKWDDALAYDLRERLSDAMPGASPGEIGDACRDIIAQAERAALHLMFKHLQTLAEALKLALKGSLKGSRG